MGNRRSALVMTSDDAPPPSPSHRRSPTTEEDEPRNQRKRKDVNLNDDDDDDDEEEEEEEEGVEPKPTTEEDEPRNQRKRKDVNLNDDDDDYDEEEEEEEEGIEPKPLGDVVRVSGKGRLKRDHYLAFQYDCLRFDLEDPVLISPEVENQKPKVVIIKDIYETKGGTMMVMGQRLYRPEEAEKKCGGHLQSNNTRELFYSFQQDEITADSVMHKCVVHFIPVNKQIPRCNQHPGFIVQKVYDTGLKRVFKLTDKAYEDNKQCEIDLLVQKTMSRLGDLPDVLPPSQITSSN